jgi:hypothetical protein
LIIQAVINTNKNIGPELRYSPELAEEAFNQLFLKLGSVMRSIMYPFEKPVVTAAPWPDMMASGAAAILAMVGGATSFDTRPFAVKKGSTLGVVHEDDASNTRVFVAEEQSYGVDLDATTKLDKLIGDPLSHRAGGRVFITGYSLAWNTALRFTAKTPRPEHVEPIPEPLEEELEEFVEGYTDPFDALNVKPMPPSPTPY